MSSGQNVQDAQAPNTDDSHSSQVRVLLFGAGSIGAVYTYQLQQAGCSVTTVCRSNYAHVKDHGFKMSSVTHGDVSFRPDHVIRDPSEAQGHFDYVLVCTKSSPGSKPSLPDLLRPVLDRSPHAAIVLAQNGIMIEEEVAQAFPTNPIISAVVYLPATQSSHGVIQHPEPLNLLELGTYPADAPANHKRAASSFAELMRQGGGGAEVHDDIQVARWSKIIMNAVWNPICALTLCSDGDFLTTSTPFAHDLAWGIMLEIVDLAQKVGFPQVTREVAEQRFSIAKRRAETGTGREVSMLQDIRLSRPLEVEAILGNTVRVARQHDMKLLRLETIYALTTARNVALIKEVQK